METEVLLREVSAVLFDRLSRLPVLGFSAEREFEGLRALREEAQALLLDDAVRFFEAAPAGSDWSPAQHIFHNQRIVREIVGERA
jgi:hypothetical protein